MLIFTNMRKKFETSVKIPEGVECQYENGVLKFKKGEVSLSRKISIPRTEVKIAGNKVNFICEKANKKDVAIIKTNFSHLNNLLKGLDEEFVYKMEICNVHFPMTVKVNGNKVIVSNFLGEKINREANILEGVEVQIKGNQITVSSRDKELAGQTSSNIEKATRVPKKDRRVFQDGIFLVSKAGKEI